MKTLERPTANKTRISPAKKAAQERLKQCLYVLPFAEKQVNKTLEESGEGTSDHRRAVAYLKTVNDAIAECHKKLK